MSWWCCSFSRRVALSALVNQEDGGAVQRLHFGPERAAVALRWCATGRAVIAPGGTAPAAVVALATLVKALTQQGGGGVQIVVGIQGVAGIGKPPLATEQRRICLLYTSDAADE